MSETNEHPCKHRYEDHGQSGCLHPADDDPRSMCPCTWSRSQIQAAEHDARVISSILGESF